MWKGNSMGLSANIDWISATFPFGFDKEKWQAVTLPIEKDLGIPAKAMNGYSEAYKYPSGAIVMTNDDRPDMGVHITYSAQSIARVFELYKTPQQDLLEYIMRHAKITRIDVCVDVSDVQIDILDLYLKAKQGFVKTRSNSFGFIESAKKGKEIGAQTMYVGSQKKRKKLLRVYDKGAQLGLESYLTRFELECRGEIGHNAGTVLRGTKISDYGIVIAGMIKAFADFTQTQVGEFFNVDEIPVALPKYRKSDTAQWLLSTVAKTLAKETWLDNDLFPLFVQAFKEYYQEIASEYEKKTGGV